MAIAFFSTWTTYGTWLPGDERGWFERGRMHAPNLMRKFEAALRMREDAITLQTEQRCVVESTIVKHCMVRNWILHAVNCRTNHVHVVVSAPDQNIDVPREQFKAWCTRRLAEHARQFAQTARQAWWTQRGWDEFVDDEAALANMIAYVRDGQDFPER